jgi:hypothetical protein
VLQREAAAQKIRLNVLNDTRFYAVDFELRKKRLVGRNISGKYLLGLLLRRVRTVFDVPGTQLESAAYRLAEYCTFSSLLHFQRSVSHVISRRSHPRPARPV